MARLIVNGDDFALTPRVSDGILQAHRDGILTSTSVLACGVDFERAVQQLPSVPDLDCGVHLALVQERPILEPERVPSLVDRQGRFHLHATVFARRYVAGRISFTEVEAELDAQIRKVLDHGIWPTHIDSHQHVHFLPRVLDVALRLARKYDIPAIRLPRRMALGVKLRDGIRGLQLRVLDHLAVRAGELDLRRTDGFAGFMAGGHLRQAKLVDTLARLPADGTFELMCHPGLPDPTSPYLSWNYEWNEELQALTSTATREVVEARRIQLIGYRELTGI